MVQPLWKTVWRFLRKLKIELPFDPAVPLLGIYPEIKHDCKRHMDGQKTHKKMFNITHH